MIPLPFLAGQKVAVVGLGRSGLATARALRDSGANPVLWDDGEMQRERAQEEGFPLADFAAQTLSGYSLMVWSPGIPHSFPAPHPIAVSAREAGIPLVCDIDLLARARPQCRFVGITGTNGKSTTTTLVAHILREAGLSIAVGGNLGRAALDLEPLDERGTYVLELSSYQLELCPSARFDVGILLNITPDHLSRHGGMDGYIAAKKRLFGQLTPAGLAVIGLDDPNCRAIRDELLTSDRRIATISAQDDASVHAEDGVLIAESDLARIDLTQIASLPGRHNWQNAAAAFAACRALGVPPDRIAAALKTYPGLAHRQEVIGRIGNVTFVNDSKATNADAAEKALSCYDDIFWILGGQAKEGGIDSLTPYFDRIRHAFLIGEAAPEFAKVLQGKVAFTQCGDLDRATMLAHDIAQQEAKSGAVVLLSPACASWDQFKSFEHRGDAFRDLVQKLARESAA